MSEFDIISFLQDRALKRLHKKEDLENFCNLAAKGLIPDYQISAWLMAAYLNPMSPKETVELTLAMSQSGKTLDLTSLPQPSIDKHSTGGVGDKTTFVLLPLLAACDVTTVKMSGRGLGITGGTLDKVASIPGFRTDLQINEILRQAKEIGIVLTGQSESLAPADKVFYSLRDATATVDSITLIVSSILSKKIAGGAKNIILDVKCGSGGFMTSLDQARLLQDELKFVGSACGLNITTHISDMSQPLGEAIGNALEVEEAFRILQNLNLTSNSRRFRDFCIEIGTQALITCGKTTSIAQAKAMIENALDNESAWSKAKDWMSAQGATQFAPFIEPLPFEDICAYENGYLHQIDAGAIGRAIIELGGGRMKKEASIDHSVGIIVHALIGDEVHVGQSLCTVFFREYSQFEVAKQMILSGIKIRREYCNPTPMLYE